MHMSFRNSILSSQGRLSCALRKFGANLCRLFGRKFSHTVSDTECLSAFVSLVGHIQCLRPKKKVRWIDARLVIAAMQNKTSRGNLANEKAVASDVRPNGFVAVESEFSIPAWLSIARPFPAARFDLLYFGLKIVQSLRRAFIAAVSSLSASESWGVDPLFFTAIAFAVPLRWRFLKEDRQMSKTFVRHGLIVTYVGAR